MVESPFEKVNFFINEIFMKRELNYKMKNNNWLTSKLRYFNCCSAACVCLCGEKRRLVIRKWGRCRTQSSQCWCTHEAQQTQYLRARMLSQNWFDPRLLGSIIHIVLGRFSPKRKKIKTKVEKKFRKWITKIAQLLNIFKMWIFGKNY